MTPDINPYAACLDTDFGGGGGGGRGADLPQWSADTVQENAVFVNRVRCSRFLAGPGGSVPGLDPGGGLLRFAASTAPGDYPLRLSLLYTPLQPAAGVDFAAAAGGGGTPPTLQAVVSGTGALGTAALLNSSDVWPADGSVVFGPMSSDLYVRPGQQAPRYGPGGAGVGALLSVPSFADEPAGLSLSVATDCGGGAAAGNLSWDVQPGWDGLAYRLCVVARPACVPAAVTALPGVLASRCFYVVVPKCQRCFRQGGDPARERERGRKGRREGGKKMCGVLSPGNSGCLKW